MKGGEQVFSPSVHAAAETYQQLEWINLVDMEAIIHRELRVATYGDVGLQNAYQIFFKKMTASSTTREMQDIQQQHRFRVGGEDGTIRPSVVVFDLEKHAAFLDQYPGEPFPERVEIERSLIEKRKKGKWHTVAEPVITFTVSQKEKPVTKKRRRPLTIV